MVVRSMRCMRKAASMLALLVASALAQSHDMAPAKAHWSAPEAAAKRANPVPATKASLEQGRQLFKQNCLACHGPTGRGDGPAAASLHPHPADLAIMAGHHPDGDLAWKIANGRGAMPPWKGALSEQQIWTLVTYIRSLSAMESQPSSKEHHH